MKNKRQNDDVVSLLNKLYKLAKKACNTSTCWQHATIVRELYNKIIAEIELQLSTEKRLLAQVRSKPELAKEVSKIIEQTNEDLKAAKRLLSRHDRLQLSTICQPSVSVVPTRAQIPKSVGDMLVDYLATQDEPFTVDQALKAVAAIRPEITASAVAQALRRMVNVNVKLAQKGKGPLPAYYQRISGAEGTRPKQ